LSRLRRHAPRAVSICFALAAIHWVAGTIASIWCAMGASMAYGDVGGLALVGALLLTFTGVVLSEYLGAER
jgi:hypothetical protein